MNTDTTLEYLRSFLEDEFRNYNDVRVRVRFRSGTRRSPDLVQDYDPESKSLHSATGVEVRARHRDYFFRLEFTRREIEAQCREIHEFLEGA